MSFTLAAHTGHDVKYRKTSVEVFSPSTIEFPFITYIVLHYPTGADAPLLVTVVVLPLVAVRLGRCWRALVLTEVSLALVVRVVQICVRIRIGARPNRIL